MKNKYKVYKTITFLLIIFTINIIAQPKGSLEGRLFNKETMQPVPYANVIVLGTNFGAATNERGEYKINNIPEGIYKLKYSAIGFASHVESEIRVVAHKTRSVKDIELIETAISTDSVVVSAGFFSEDMTESITTFSYNREEIKRSPGATGDIFRAIETLPGVSSSGGEFSAFSVRGGSPRDNIILIDNIPFDRVSHFEGGTEKDDLQGGRFSMFAPGVIDDAKFQAGAFGAEYGGKTASVIDLKIKEGNRESYRVNGTYDLLGWEINYDGPTYLLDNTSLMLSARNQNFDTMLEMVDQKDVGQMEFSDVILKTVTDFSSKHRLSLLGIYAPEEFERNVNNILEAKDDNYTSYIGSSEETKYVIGGTWRFLTGNNSFLRNTIYYKGTEVTNNHGKAYLNPKGGGSLQLSDIKTRPNYIRINNDEYQYGLRSQFSYSPINSSPFSTGLELYQINFNYHTIQDGLDTLFTFDRNDYREGDEKFIITDPQFINNMYDGTSFNAAAFLEYQLTLMNRLTLTPGLRYEYNDFNQENYFSPRFSASYFLTDRIKLMAAAGLYYQAPDLRYIAEDQQNKQLSNEKAIHYIAGITAYLSDDLKFTTELYYKDLSNLITYLDRTTNQRANKGDGFAKGLDISFVKKFSTSWYGQINYSYCESRRKDNDGLGWYDSDFNRPHVFNILFGYELNEHWSFSTKWRFSTGRPKDAYIIHKDVIPNSSLVRYSKEIIANNTERLDDLHTLNLRVDYRHDFGGVPMVNNLSLIVFLDILNVYNHLNVNKQEFNPVTGQVVKQGFEMLPTLGFRIEF